MGSVTAAASAAGVARGCATSALGWTGDGAGTARAASCGEAAVGAGAAAAGAAAGIAGAGASGAASSSSSQSLLLLTRTALSAALACSLPGLRSELRASPRRSGHACVSCRLTGAPAYGLVRHRGAAKLAALIPAPKRNDTSSAALYNSRAVELG